MVQVRRSRVTDYPLNPAKNSSHLGDCEARLTLLAAPARLNRRDTELSEGNDGSNKGNPRAN